MKAAVEEELHRLERIGVIEKVSMSEWAMPVIAVPKKDGTIRLCGDYKVTINQAIDVDQYPLPVPEALFATLSGAQQFTTLDLSQAYLAHRLSNFLISYRSTRHSTTGQSRSELFLRRRIRTRLDLLKPDAERQVLDKQAQQKLAHDKRARENTWTVGERVMARNVGSGPNWVPATITKVLGSVTYEVKRDNGQVWKQHVEQLKKFVESNRMKDSTEEQELPWVPAAGESTHPENTPQSNEVEPSEIVPDESLPSENSPPS